MSEEAIDADGRTEEEESAEDSDSSNDDTDAEPATPPPPIELPDRKTRGRRLRAKVEEDEEEADNDFWTQDFFAEGNADEDYETESSDSDRADSDFDRKESSDDEGEGNEERLRHVLNSTKSKEKPPGWKQAVQRRANLLRAKRLREQAANADVGADASDGPSTSAATSVSKPAPGTDMPIAPVLRRSTYQKREVDEMRRQIVAPRKSVPKKDKDPEPALTMEDVLRRAAADSLANRAALAHMMAREEESKARATAAQAAYDGPSLKWRSRTVATEPAHSNNGGTSLSAPRATDARLGTHDKASTSYRVEASEIELVKTSLAHAPELGLGPRADMNVPHGLVIDARGAAQPRTTRVVAATACPRRPAEQCYGDLSNVDWGVPRAACFSPQPHVDATALQPVAGSLALLGKDQLHAGVGSMQHLERSPLTLHRPAALLSESSHGTTVLHAKRTGGNPAADLASEPAALDLLGAAQQSDGAPAVLQHAELTAVLPASVGRRGVHTLQSDDRVEPNGAQPRTVQNKAGGREGGAVHASTGGHAPLAAYGVMQQKHAAGLQRQMLWSQPATITRNNVTDMGQSIGNGRMQDSNGTAAQASAYGRLRDGGAPLQAPQLLQGACSNGQQQQRQQQQQQQQQHAAPALAAGSHSALLHQQALQLLQRHQQVQMQLSLEHATRAQATAAASQHAANQHLANQHLAGVYTNGAHSAPPLQHAASDQTRSAMQHNTLLAACAPQQHGGSQVQDAGLPLQQFKPG